MIIQRNTVMQGGGAVTPVLILSCVETRNALLSSDSKPIAIGNIKS